MHITITPFGETEMSREILGFAVRAEDPTPVFSAIHQSFLDFETKQFDSQGQAGGQPWAPLKDSTVAAKAAAGLDPRILHATLRLRDSLTSASSSDHIYQRQGNAYYHRLIMGSDVDYGKYHQSRSPRPSGLPRRPPVSLPEDVKREWVKMLQRWIVYGDVV